FKAGCAGFSRKLEPSFAIQGRGRRARGAARAIHAGYDARPAVGRNPIRGSIVRRHGQCRRALFPFVENELNLLAFREGLESFAFDVPVMDEYVGTVFPFYESEPLPVVKPFDGSLHSGRHTPSSGGSKLPWSCCGAPAPEGGLRAAYSSRRAQIGKTSIRCGIAGFRGAGVREAGSTSARRIDVGEVRPAGAIEPALDQSVGDRNSGRQPQLTAGN